MALGSSNGRTGLVEVVVAFLTFDTMNPKGSVTPVVPEPFRVN
jgi:hypothetical protein